MKPTKLIALGVMALSSVIAFAQVQGLSEKNTSIKTNDDNECAIAINPNNKNQVFISSNTSTTGLFCARSTDGGLTWTYPDPSDKTLADGDAGQGAAACCDPSLTWDSFGNLYLTYINSAVSAIVTLVSTDAGATFTQLASFSGSVDQPTVVSANTSQPTAPVAVYVVWNQSGAMVARGAPVTGLGTIGAFAALQSIPGSSGYSFGDVAIAPSGAVVLASGRSGSGQGPDTIRCNIDPDGFGAQPFGAQITVSATNVGGFDFITPQNARSIDAETGLAYDACPTSPHFGRLYCVYTDETVNENNDTEIRLRWSDNNGTTWSNFIRVNDDSTTRSQFLPKIATNPKSGNIAICWHDCRNSATNRAAELWATVATPQGASPTFLPNAKVSGGASTSNSAGVEFGDYMGLAYSDGWFFPAWADTSNSTGNNPNGTTRFEAHSNRVTGGALANEGPRETLSPTAETIVRGTNGSGGNLASWSANDGNLRKICKFFVPNANAPYAIVDLSYVTTITAPTAVSLNTRVAAKTGGSQDITLRIRNKTSGLFVDTNVVNQAIGTLPWDSQGTAAGTLSDYVDVGGAMKGEIEIRATGFQAVSFPCVEFDSALMVVTG